MRFAGAAFALASAVLLAGCGSWNPLVAAGLMAKPVNQPTPLAAFEARVSPRAAWTAPVGKGGGYRFRPDVEGGRVYAASSEGVITVVEEESGRVVAKPDLKKKLSGGVDFDGGRIVVGTIKGEVIAVDEAGKVLWTTSVAGEVIAPPAQSKDVVVVRTSDGRIFGLAAQDGKRRWVFQRPTPALLLRSEAGVVAVGGDVVAGYPNGKVIALDIEDGRLTWEASVSLPRGATELERIADVAGLPLIDAGTLCAAAFQGKVACFDIQSRNLLWSRDLSSSLGVVRDGRHLYIIDDSGAVHALDKGTGASVWKQDKLLWRRSIAPVLSGGYLLVGDGFGFVHVLATEDGRIVGRLATDGSAIISLTPSAQGALAQTANGSLVAVRL